MRGLFGNPGIRDLAVDTISGGSRMRVWGRAMLFAFALLGANLAAPWPATAEGGDSTAALSAPADATPEPNINIRTPQNSLAYLTQLRQNVARSAIVLVQDGATGTMLPVKYNNYFRMKRMQIMASSRSPRQGARRLAQFQSQLAHMQQQSLEWVDRKIQDQQTNNREREQ